jgi:TonB family protein
MLLKITSLANVNLALLLATSSFVSSIISSNASVLALPKLKVYNTGALTLKDCLKCDLEYAESLRKEGIESNVTLSINTDKNGDVQSVRLVRSSGRFQLEDDAIIQTQKWKFKPSSTERKNSLIRIHYTIAKQENKNANVIALEGCLQCEAKYIESLMKKRIEGEVTVAIDVDTSGNIENPRLVQSSGHIELDKLAIKEAFSWKTIPSATERKNIQVLVKYKRLRQRAITPAQ